MMKKILCTVIVFLFTGVASYSQSYEKIHSDADAYYTALADDSPESGLLMQKLKSGLKKNLQGSAAGSIYKKLSNEFSRYEKKIKNISNDSALVLYNDWYLKLSAASYDNSEKKFFSSGKDKIILFSASVSCYCTLRMCRKQTAEIIKFAKENNLDYWVIDSYENNDLQIKYETLFAPSVILFDGRNNILTKIEYDEKMIELLNNFYSKENRI